MPIQFGAPATIKFSFRVYDEAGTDLGAMNLTNPEYQPLKLRLKRPDYTVIEVLDAGLVETNPALGLVEWQAAAGALNKPGTWTAQVWAGSWPSHTVQFLVLGPNV